MNYYEKGGQARGLKSLAQELPKYGRYGDDVVAHISSDEANMLKSMGGSGTINPQTGLPEFFIKKAFQSVAKPIQRAIGQTNPFNPGSAAGKAIGSIPGVKEAQNLGTQVFQPLEKAVVQPASRGLASFDKAVGKAIPGGWGTVASIAGSAIGLPTPALMGLGALTGSGVMKKGGSFNLQGALIGGASAYASAKLGDYLRAAAPGAGEAVSETATNLIPESALPELLNAPLPDMPIQLSGPGTAFAPASLTSADVGALNALSAPLEAGAGAGLQAAPAPSIGSNILGGNFGYAADQIKEGIGNAVSNAYTSAGEGLKSLGNDATSAFKASIDPSTYTKYGSERLSDLGQTASGIKSVLTGNINPAATAAVKAGTLMSPTLATAGTVYGAMTLSDLDAQRDFLKQQQAAGNIAQAEYDAALAEIDRQANIARETVGRSPFSTTPDRDVSIGETFYGRGGAEDSLYGRGDAGNTLYAMGGSVDDESGMDEARGMMQGNLQKGLFGRGYAAGGQIDMGNGYNPFSNLPPMSGPLGAAGQLPTAQNQPSFARSPYGIGPSSVNTTTEQDMTGGNRNGISGGLSSIFSGLGGSTPFSSSILNATPQPLGGQFAHNTQQDSYPSLDKNPNTNIGSFAGSSPFYGEGGGGGSSGAFPLQGQYGIVKMAAGGMPPRFLSGGGDGMSDSIPATINGNQEARLADGEFVIPADVVSHLGNGSSKAGAKQLYSMMDKVRKARTGNPKQGKQINPRKFLAA